MYVSTYTNKKKSGISKPKIFSGKSRKKGSLKDVLLTLWEHRQGEADLFLVLIGMSEFS